MKKIYYLLIIFALANITHCTSNSNEENSASKENLTADNNMISEKISEENLPVIEFEEKLHDFGVITEGEVVTHTFKYKNTGKSNLVISAARASCGCTASDWSKEPLPPGEEASVKIKFNSNGKRNKVRKTVSLTSNASKKSVLTITAEIKSK